MKNDVTFPPTIVIIFHIPLRIETTPSNPGKAIFWPTSFTKLVILLVTLSIASPDFEIASPADAVIVSNPSAIAGNSLLAIANATFKPFPIKLVMIFIIVKKPFKVL